MGIIIAVANQKGGVGKTTTAVNLGVGLAKHHKKVLMVDLDPQGSLTTSLGIIPWEQERTVVDLLEMAVKRQPFTTDDIRSCIQNLAGLDLLPANARLSMMDSSLILATKREYMLKKVLDKVKNDYDYIIIDVLPSLGILNINALTAADELIVPMKAQFLDMQGFEMLLDVVQMIQEDTNENLKVCGVLLTMMDTRLKMSKQIENAIKTNYGERLNVFDVYISPCTKLSEASAMGVSIFDYAAAGCKAVKEYELLVKAVENLCSGR